jgi:PAS domain-containing protein
MKTGHGFVIEQRIITSRGETRIILSRGEALFNSSGKVVGLFGTSQDITEQRRLQNAFQEMQLKATG